MAMAIIGCSSDDAASSQPQESANTDDDSNAMHDDQVSCRNSNCPNEPQVFTTEEECRARAMAPCYQEELAWIACRKEHEECGADGRIVRSSIMACAEQLKTLNDCAAAANM